MRGLVLAPIASRGGVQAGTDIGQTVGYRRIDVFVLFHEGAAELDKDRIAVGDGREERQDEENTR